MQFGGAAAQGRKWVFTIHAALAAVEPELRVLFESLNSPKWGEYGGAQLERAPETHRLHIQGFCVFATNQRFQSMKKVHGTAHWELMRGKLDDSERYCSKADTREPGTESRVWGVRPVSKQGARTDLSDAVATLRGSTGGLTQRMRALAADHPLEFVKYHRGFEALARLETPVLTYTWAQPRRWQLELLGTLGAQPDDRHILWFTDTTGGAGKSSVVRKYLSDFPGTAICLTGKLADMAYAYNGERVVFFDVSRTQSEHMDHLYSFAETLKNGNYLSTKYESCMKTFQPPHVVFFANMDPAAGKWSDDRLVLKRLDWQDILPAE